MVKCLKCKKEFKYQSDLNKHKNRKTPCDKVKDELKCNLCNINFKWPAEQVRHEKTKKHITNITINGNNGNIHIGDNNNYNNIIHLTLNTNSFVNTDMSFLGFGIISDIGQIYLDILNKPHMSINDKVCLAFDEVIFILEKLHFNITIERNHNLKILLVFPALKQTVYENLILEIDQNTKHITWRSVDYKTLINNILDHLLILNNRSKNEKFINFVHFLKKYLLDDNEISSELEPIINKKLSQMYVDFNKKQNKPERDIKFSFNEKLQEYLNYRNKETTLVNGFKPDVIESQF